MTTTHKTSSLLRLSLLRTLVWVGGLLFIAQGMQAQTTNSPEYCYIHGSIEINSPGDSPWTHGLRIMDKNWLPLFKVQDDGKVGIKTDTPTAELDVAGTVKATTFIGDGSQLTGLPTGTGSTLWTELPDTTSIYTMDKIAIGQNWTGAQVNINSPSSVAPLYVRVDGQVAMAVYNNNGVGIGGSISGGPHADGLVVNGMTSIGQKGWGAKFFVKSGTGEHPAQFYTSSGRALLITKDAGLAVGGGTYAPADGASFEGTVEIGETASFGYSLKTFGDAIIKGDMSVTGDVCASNVTCPSDSRFKTDVQELQDCLAKVGRLRPVSYDWKRDEFPDRNFEDARQVGLIAQELETVFPTFVRTDEAGYKSVDYSRLTPVLIGALQEQQRQIDALQSELSAARALEGRIRRLEATVSIDARHESGHE